VGGILKLIGDLKIRHGTAEVIGLFRIEENGVRGPLEHHYRRIRKMAGAVRGKGFSLRGLKETRK